MQEQLQSFKKLLEYCDCYPSHFEAGCTLAVGPTLTNFSQFYMQLVNYNRLDFIRLLLNGTSASVGP